MSQSRLIELSYYDPKAEVRLTAYADTLVLDEGPKQNTMTAIRFGGYPEMVNAMAAAIHGGAAIDATIRDESIRFQCIHKGYTKQLSHDGVYATATMMANDQAQEAINSEEQEDEETLEQPRTCYIFCPAGDRTRLFEELDRKTAAPMIPEFREQILDALIADGSLHRMKVYALKGSMEAWALSLKPEDKNIVEVLERGLKDGSIRIPGADSSKTDEFSQVGTVTQYLNTFGVTVADRIRNQFDPLFDPASEPLSDEVLAVNEYIRSAAGYPLYDAQLAVAESVRRKLRRGKVAIIRAECGSGKTKIGSTALGALYARKKTFNVVMCPSHITKKWVREIGETLPDTYGMVVKSPAEFDRLYGMYASGDKSVYAIMSKEKARDGYMRYPAVNWSNRQKGFLCPDCREPVQMEISDDGTKYFVNADQFFFLNENKKNHKCLNCGSVLWAPVSNTRKLPWIKISKYGWVYRHGAAQHLDRTKNETVREQLLAIIEQPEALYPTRGAQRRFPLSTYVKKRYRGRVDALLCDELHEYNNDSGQGDAMAELYGAARKFIGMTATLINGYSSGIFHLLYRIVPGLMQKDGKPYTKPGLFDGEYGVTETVYSIEDPEYNSNRRAARTGTKTRQLPGVSPLVFSRFLLEHTAFLGLEDMGKDLPDYEEIPVPLKLDDEVQDAYKDMEKQLTRVLRTDRRVARKILSTYLNLLTVYPDQPYDQPPVLHPIDGLPIVAPPDLADFDTTFAKEEKTLEIVKEKVANGGRVIIYTSWTRTDSQDKLLKLLREEGIKTDVMAEVNGELAERQELVESIAIALLTRSNLFILGKPGQAKSHSINLFRQRITGMRQFERQMSKQADEEQLFGRIDLSSLIPGSVPETALSDDPVYQNLKAELDAQVCQLTGIGDADGVFELLRQNTEKLNAYRAAFAALHPSEPTVQTAGKIPEADIVFLDEIFKANDGILNSLLAALNERRYTNEGHTYNIPVISFFTASNEIPNFADPQEKSLEALFDRLQIKVVTEDISDRGNRLALLRKKQSGGAGQILSTITLDELLSMQQEVKAVTVPDSINELADDILCELRRGGISVSDRKYLNFAPLAQAKAWLEGHSSVQAQDMLVLRNYLWQKPGDRTAVDAVLNRLCVNPMQTKVEELARMALDAQEDFQAAKAAGTGSTTNKALIKLRAELIRLYRSQQELNANAQRDSEKAMVASLLDGLEQISKSAHEEAGFTYAPLAQLEALQ